MISSAGAGGGSFNHRFAMPGVAGNSVLSILRPVDLPPFTDEGLLARAQAARVDAEDLLHLLVDRVLGARRIPHPHERRRPNGRAAGDDVASLFPGGDAAFVRAAVVGSRRTPIAVPALHQLCPAAVGDARAAPRSRRLGAQRRTSRRRRSIRRLRRGSWCRSTDVRFPAAPSFPFATYMPQVWRMDFGSALRGRASHHQRAAAIGCAVSPAGASGECGRKRRVRRAPARRWRCRLAHTPAGMSRCRQLSDLGYLAGLIGGVRTLCAHQGAAGKERRHPSLRWRALHESSELSRSSQGSRRKQLVRQRFMRGEDVPAVVLRAGDIWNAVDGDTERR